MPADVNNDGVVSPMDALLVAHDLYRNGPHRLDAPAPAPVLMAAAASVEVRTASAEVVSEDEGSDRKYLDVNGDNYVSAADLLLVASELRAGAQAEMVQFRLETTDLAGTPVSEVTEGDSFLLKVYVDDARPDDPTLGVFQAYVDVTFDDTLATATGSFTPGPAYQENTSGSVAAGLLDEAGGVQTGLGWDPPGSLGPAEFLLFSHEFVATAAGTVTFESFPADGLLYHEVILFDDPMGTVANEDIAFGTTTLTINEAPNNAPVANDDGPGPDYTTDEDAPFTTGNVLDNDTDPDGDPLSVVAYEWMSTLGGLVDYNDDGTFDYDPNGQFDYLAFGEQATDSFEYLVTDGDLVSDWATVTITINGGPAEGLVQFRLVTTDLGGTPVTDVDRGDNFLLNVFVQDTRPDTFTDRGVFAAFVDVTFDDTLASATGSFTFGAAYQERTSGSVAVGLLDEAGGVQTGLGGPPFDGALGPAEFLLFSHQFEAVASGMVVFASEPADLPVHHEVLLFDPPNTVANEDIVFRTTSLTINATPVVAVRDQFNVDEDSSDNYLDVLLNDVVNSGGTLTITGVGPTDKGGTVFNNGDHLLYTPLLNFTGTETFTYTIDDGLGNTDDTTVVMTVDNVNDAPLANDDGGAEYTTGEEAAFTTGNVLDNDTDIDGDALTVLSFVPTGTLGGLVSYNGDGTFNYDPNGQFDYLAFGEQATDTFTYIATDGDLESGPATVTITVTGTPPALGDITGFVYADTDNDGIKDSVERALGDVEVRLVGTDVLGTPVSLGTVTDALGHYAFTDVNPGNYVLIEVQPEFFLDGIDRVNGVVHTGTNDRITLSPDTKLVGLNVNFGERSLHPDYMGTGDYLNIPPRIGIEVALDSQGNQLWYSLLDGWGGVTSVKVTLSANGSTAFVTVSKGTSGDVVFSVPTSPLSRQYRVKGQTSEGRVVQIIGTLADFEQQPSGMLAGGQTLHNEDLVDAVFAELESEAL